MQMVKMLADVIDDTGILVSVGILANVFDRLALILGASKQLIAVFDVGEVMLVVVELQRLGRHKGCQRVIGIGKVREFQCHK